MINKVRSNRQKGDRTRSRLEKGQHFFQHNSTLFKYLKKLECLEEKKNIQNYRNSKKYQFKRIKKKHTNTCGFRQFS